LKKAGTDLFGENEEVFAGQPNDVPGPVDVYGDEHKNGCFGF
jgi:hypothetical protein